METQTVDIQTVDFGIQTTVQTTVQTSNTQTDDGELENQPTVNQHQDVQETVCI